MITEQERIIRESQGYDLGFEFNGRKYWLNTNDWNEEKEERFREETGLCTYREERGKQHLVIYEPKYFEVWKTSDGTEILSFYKTDAKLGNIPQPMNMTTCYMMFATCKMRTIDLSNWDMSNVVDCASMFSACRNLEEMITKGWNFSKVKDISSMFSGCASLRKLDLSHWDVSNVRSSHRVFGDCKNLQSLNLTGWDMPRVVTTELMFEECAALSDLKLNHDFIFSKGAAFMGCDALQQRYRKPVDKEFINKIIQETNSSLQIMNAF